MEGKAAAEDRLKTAAAALRKLNYRALADIADGTAPIAHTVGAKDLGGISKVEKERLAIEFEWLVAMAQRVPNGLGPEKFPESEF